MSVSSVRSRCRALFSDHIGTVGWVRTRSRSVPRSPAAPWPRHAPAAGGTYSRPPTWPDSIYGEASPGSGIDFTTILATIPAYSAGIITDGFGYGGYGQGGYGAAAG